ncbi:helix-hairpin-helix domain-containing protein [Fodinisporobacter ferrooxydans]|uniref:Helix-hairpin-helix domain-containing protein n=1 Tax=Fodinisporobacter ferrooxydans TaxID=2901836 RepID=A0ABY4CEF7_9BACL|nr:helix-hairpin-helix domain-containing protein [Alicyclobacillaceae bacterium MYW30-H2]
MQTLTRRERWLISLALFIVFGIGVIYAYTHRQQDQGNSSSIPQQYGAKKTNSKYSYDQNVNGSSTAFKQAAIKVDVKGAVNQPGLYTLPTGSRVADAIQAAGGLNTHADTETVNLATALVDGDEVNVPAIPVPANKSTAAGTKKININTATAEELDTLSGIGPTRAKEIVQYRLQHGLFLKAEDLLNIEGFGVKLLDKIKDQITVH